MNLREGTRRIKKVGSVCNLVGTGVAALGLVHVLLLHFTSLPLPKSNAVFWPFVFLTFGPILFGAFFQLAGYIVEGFAQPQ